jgi:hypothetical protein
MDREGSIKLLSAILADIPRLPGASCTGKRHMFDPAPGNGRQYQRQEQIRLAETAWVLRWLPVIGRCTTVITVARSGVDPGTHP